MSITKPPDNAGSGWGTPTPITIGCDGGVPAAPSRTAYIAVTAVTAMASMALVAVVALDGPLLAVAGAAAAELVSLTILVKVVGIPDAQLRTMEERIRDSQKRGLMYIPRDIDIDTDDQDHDQDEPTQDGAA